MPGRTMLGLLLACAAVAPAQAIDAGLGPVPADEARQFEQARAWRSHNARVADALAETGRARELAFAAMLASVAGDTVAMPSGDALPGQEANAEIAAWREAALALAGDDVMANQMLAVDDGADRALRARAAARWHALEPGNLAPLAYLGLPVDALLALARDTDHSDSHTYDVVRWMQSALLRHSTAAEWTAVADDAPADAAGSALAWAMGLWIAHATPARAALSGACRGEALRATPARPVDCRHVATLLAERSDMLIEGAIGWAMLRELADGDAERAHIAARRRRVDWQRTQWLQAIGDDPGGEVALVTRLLGDASIATEAQMIERALQDVGIPLEPPPGWRSPSGHRD